MEDVQAYVLGGHGDQMVPVRSLTTVGGIPVQKWVDLGKLTGEQLQKIEDDTRQGGGILTGLIGTSAWYAPGVATAEMVEAVLLDRKRILATTVLLDGQYGVSGLYFGVPALLGAGGAEEVYDLTQLAPLTEDGTGRHQRVGGQSAGDRRQPQSTGQTVAEVRKRRGASRPGVFVFVRPGLPCAAGVRQGGEGSACRN